MITEWGIPGAYIPFPWIELIQHITYSVSKIKLLCILASEVGLERVQSQFPDVEVGAMQCNIDGARSHVE
jgi:hypothetical protein